MAFDFKVFQLRNSKLSRRQCCDIDDGLILSFLIEILYISLLCLSHNLNNDCKLCMVCIEKRKKHAFLRI